MDHSPRSEAPVSRALLAKHPGSRIGAWRALLLVLIAVAATLSRMPAVGAQTAAGHQAPTTVVPTTAPGDQPADEAPFVIFGNLTVQTSQGRSPVAGVTLSVRTEDGKEAGTAVSGEDGRWELGVPEGGSYTVTLEVDTLPDGIGLGPNAQVERNVSFEGGRERVGALFALSEGGSSSSGPSEQSGEGGPSGGEQRGDVERFLQLLVEGIRFGLLLGLMSIGLSLIFGTTGLTNFAHAEMVTFGALAAFFFNVTLGLHLIPAAILATVAGGLAGASLDWGIFKRLRRRGVSLISQLVVSIGLSMLLRYVFLYVFAGRRRDFAQYAVQKGFKLGPVTTRPKDLITIAVSVVVLCAVGYLLLRTRAGRAMRAVADNRDLAASSGINVERVILQVWVLGGALAALSGVMFGLSESVAWDMGYKILLLIFAGVTLGGLGTAFGAAVGSVIIGVLVMVGTLAVPPELKNVGALLVLILVLVIRPQGILGRAERIG